jgi:hypothetical protein
MARDNPTLDLILRQQQQPNGVVPRGEEAEPPVALVVNLGDVQTKPVHWLWRPWIPLGSLTLLDGDPGLGKSTILIDITARVSRGWAMPPGGAGTGTPANVLLLGAEDNLANTVRPRLDAAGADVTRVDALEAIKVGAEELPPVLPWDLLLVANMVIAKQIKLIVIDPFFAFLDGKIDAHRDPDVRRCMYKLKVLAERLEVAIVLVRHLNKLNAGPALYRGGGSIAISAAARSALVVGKVPGNGDQCALAPVKCNLGPKPRALLYTLEPVGNVSRVGWIGETDLTADEIIAHPNAKARAKKSKECAARLEDLLVAGEMEADIVEAELRNEGFSEYAIKAARKLLRVRTRRAGGKSGAWMISLPDEADDELLEDDRAAERNPFKGDDRG